jgi:hypothetical protein
MGWDISPMESEDDQRAAKAHRIQGNEVARGRASNHTEMSAALPEDDAGRGDADQSA